MSQLALGDHYEHFIRQQLAAGHFSTVSELICEALFLLEVRQLGGPEPLVDPEAIDATKTRSIFATVRQRLHDDLMR